MVRVAKRENVANKIDRGRFLQKGEIVNLFGSNSYLVKMENGKIRKKNCRDLKLIVHN